jgi:hypothetical protein
MNPNDDKQQRPQQGDQGQQQGGQQQRQGGQGEQYGEGSYKGTRQYNEGMKEHVKHHDIEGEARKAAPRSEEEAREMEEAERIGRGKARGEGASPDGEAQGGDVEKP